MPPKIPPPEPHSAVADRAGPCAYRSKFHDETEQAISDQKCAEADLEIWPVDVAQKKHAQRNPDHTADDEGQHASDGDVATDMDDGPDLARDRADGHQRTRDHRLHDVQPKAE